MEGLNKRAVPERGLRMSWLRVAICGVVGLVLCYLLILQVDPLELWRSLQTAKMGWVLAALASVAATVLVRAMRWRALLSPRQPVARIWRLARLIAVGQTLNTLVLARTGEVARAFLVTQDGTPARLYALGTIGAEKLLDLGLWLVLAALVLTWVPLPGWVLTAGGTLLVALFGLLLASAFVRLLFWSSLKRLPHRSRIWAVLFEWLGALWNGFVTLRQADILLPALSWTILLWGLYVFNNIAIFRALDMPGGMLAAVLVAVVLQAGTAPPSTPARIGVFEYLCVLSLGLLGVESDRSLAYGVLLHVVVLLPPMIWSAVPFGAGIRG